MKLLVVFLCAASLHAEMTVHLISNFPVDTGHYTEALKKRGVDAKVVAVDFKEYEPALLKKKGFFANLFKTKFNPPADKIVFFNVTPRQASKYDLSLLPKEKMALFMWEPKTVIKKMYRPRVQRCFSKVYTWDDGLVDGKTYFKFHYPVLQSRIAEIPAFEEKKLCTLVASDLKSSYAHELYSQRREAIRFFESIGEKGFEFYGKRWNAGEFSSYRGPVQDKVHTIKDYKFCICYENTSDAPGYVTEKIFDCFAAGIVPIYWGATNIEDYVPPDCFIDRRQFASMADLYAYMKKMKREEYEQYLERASAFLQSPAAQKFTQEQMDEAFCSLF